MRAFTTIYKEMEYYDGFGESFVKSFNSLVAELKEDWAERWEMAPEPECFQAAKRFDFFVKSWRHSAQQLDLDVHTNRTVKQFLATVYDAFAESAEA